MRQTFFYSIACVMLLLTVTSCSSISKTGYAAPFAYSEVHPEQIRAKLDFNLTDKKLGKASASYLFGFIKVGGDSKYSEVKGSETESKLFGSKVSKVKSAAIYNALKDTDSDMIVTPQYDTKKTSILFGLFQSYQVEVKGYGAKIKSLYQEK